MDRTPHADDIQWTARQREVLDLIARGHTNGEIAHELGISLAGAKWHVSEVLTKLGVASREDAAEYWKQRHRLMPRASRAVRALVGIPALGKGAAAVAVVAVVATTGIATWAATSAGSNDPKSVPAETSTTIEPRPDPALATNGTRDFTVDQATDIALAAAQGYIDKATGPSEAGRARVSGQPLSATELILRGRTFSPLKDTVSFGDAAGSAFTSGTPSDRWGFLLVADGVDHPELPGLAHVLVHVVIADGTAEVLHLGGELGPAEMSLSPPEDVQRVARGEELTAANPLPRERAAPIVFATLDDDLRRLTLSVYGDPGDPCLRFDDTATPDRIGTMCPAINIRGDVLFGLMSGGDFVVGTASTRVTSVVAVDATGTETAIPVHQLPGNYGGELVAFMGVTPPGASLELRAADGTRLYEKSLPPVDARVVPTTAWIPGFGVEGSGTAVSDEFDIPDSSERYAFIFEFPEGGGPVRVIAECDAGTIPLAEATADVPLTPQQRSIVATFPPGSTRCAIRVVAEDGVAWRLYPK